jgi:hypothetical protein
MRIAWWMLGGLLVAGCAGGSGAGSDGGTGASTGACPNDLPASCPADAAGYQATVAPLIAARCGECHVPGGPSVHYLQTYAEVYALRGACLDQVYACKMPQAGYPQLTETERQELLGWLVCGAPDD